MQRKWQQLGLMPIKTLKKLQLKPLSLEERTAGKLLQPIKSLELNDESASDTGSEISDVFAEFHQGSYLKRQPDKTYLRKCEADRRTMDGFTDDFKNTLTKCRQPVLVQGNMFHEDLDNIEREMDEMIFPNVEKCSTTISQQLADDIGCSIDLDACESDSATGTTSSMVWHLLAVKGEERAKFHATHPGFNLYRQESPHWLDKPPVPWHEMDESRKKCQSWLREQCQ